MTAIGVDVQAGGELQLRRWTHDAVALPCWRLYYNPHPGAAVHRNGICTELRPDRLVVVAPETIYTTSDRGPQRHVYVHAVGTGLEARPPGIATLALDPVLAGLVAELRRQLTDPGTGCWRVVAAALLLAAWARLPAAGAAPSEDDAAIVRALEFLRTHGDRPVATSGLAAIAGLHPATFQRRFRRATGTTPQLWHHRARIERACLLLANGDADMETVAAACGYCDRHHFTRMFTRLRGTGPAAYRLAARRLRDG